MRIPFAIESKPFVFLSCLFRALAAAPEVAPAQNTQHDGVVEGNIHISRNLTAQRMRFRLYPSYKPVPPPGGASREDEWQNIVVFLEPVE